MDSRRRSLIKTLSYRFLGAFVTGAIAWVVTKEFSSAATIGLADTVFKFGAYYTHERVWNRIPLGRREPPEYQI